MIRQLSLAILYVSSTMVFAQPLYKWVEADGSITFSPTKPSAGISYETVTRPTESSQNQATLVSVSESPASQAAPDTKTSPIAKIEYAPAQPIATPVRSNNLSKSSIAASPSSNKQSRCQDLKKRVVSLERRLKSRLTPEDMDNTVIHMARYQRNFDQYCVQ